MPCEDFVSSGVNQWLRPPALASTNVLGRPGWALPMHTLLDSSHTNTSGSDWGAVGGDIVDICIIGGGAAGLTALQVIMGTPQYKSGHWKLTLFEARHKAGGIWYVHNFCHVFPSAGGNR